MSLGDTLGVAVLTERSLRLRENPALSALSVMDAVLPVVVFTKAAARAGEDLQRGFFEALQGLQRSLEDLGSSCLVLRQLDDGSLVGLDGEAQALAGAKAGRVVFNMPRSTPLRESLPEDAVTALSSAKKTQVAFYDDLHDVLKACRGCNTFEAFEARLQAASQQRVDRQRRNQDEDEVSLPPLPKGLEIPSVSSLTFEDFASKMQWEKNARSDVPFGAWRPEARGSLRLDEDGAWEVLKTLLKRGEEGLAQTYLAPGLQALSKSSEGLDLDAALVKRSLSAQGATGALAHGECAYRMLTPFVESGALSHVSMLTARASATGKGVQRLPKPVEVEIAKRHLWHTHLMLGHAPRAHPRFLASPSDGFKFKYWQHNGAIVRYAESMPEEAAEGGMPTLIFVHGFGASSDQWRHQLEFFRKTHRVLAIDLPGFGQSEKPCISYNQYTWRNSVMDFAREVGNPSGSPLFLAGNSLGGYIAAAASAEMKDEVSGLILLNSAGLILSPEEYAALRVNLDDQDVEEWTRVDKTAFKKQPLPSPLLRFVSGGAVGFFNLQIRGLARRLYTGRPTGSDARQYNNIKRDAADPGMLDVFVAGAKLPPPTPLNELFKTFGGPILVIQGLADPLSDAKARADGMLAAAALENQVRVVAMDSAGHCPHHEIPEEANREISLFLDTIEEHRGSMEAKDEPAIDDISAIEAPELKDGWTSFRQIVLPGVVQSLSNPSHGEGTAAEVVKDSAESETGEASEASEPPRSLAPEEGLDSSHGDGPAAEVAAISAESETTDPVGPKPSSSDAVSRGPHEEVGGEAKEEEEAPAPQKEDFAFMEDSEVAERLLDVESDVLEAAGRHASDTERGEAELDPPSVKKDLHIAEDVLEGPLLDELGFAVREGDAAEREEGAGAVKVPQTTPDPSSTALDEKKANALEEVGALEEADTLEQADALEELEAAEETHIQDEVRLLQEPGRVNEDEASSTAMEDNFAGVHSEASSEESEAAKASPVEPEAELSGAAASFQDLDTDEVVASATLQPSGDEVSTLGEPEVDSDVSDGFVGGKPNVEEKDVESDEDFSPALGRTSNTLESKEGPSESSKELEAETMEPPEEARPRRKPVVREVPDRMSMQDYRQRILQFDWGTRGVPSVQDTVVEEDLTSRTAEKEEPISVDAEDATTALPDEPEPAEEALLQPETPLETSEHLADALRPDEEDDVVEAEKLGVEASEPDAPALGDADNESLNRGGDDLEKRAPQAPDEEAGDYLRGADAELGQGLETGGESRQDTETDYALGELSTAAAPHLSTDDSIGKEEAAGTSRTPEALADDYGSASLRSPSQGLGNLSDHASDAPVADEADSKGVEDLEAPRKTDADADDEEYARKSASDAPKEDALQGATAVEDIEDVRRKLMKAFISSSDVESADGGAPDEASTDEKISGSDVQTFLFSIGPVEGEDRPAEGPRDDGASDARAGQGAGAGSVAEDEITGLGDFHHYMEALSSTIPKKKDPDSPDFRLPAALEYMQGLTSPYPRRPREASDAEKPSPPRNGYIDALGAPEVSKAPSVPPDSTVPSFGSYMDSLNTNSDERTNKDQPSRSAEGEEADGPISQEEATIQPADQQPLTVDHVGPAPLYGAARDQHLESSKAAAEDEEQTSQLQSWSSPSKAKETVPETTPEAFRSDSVHVDPAVEPLSDGSNVGWASYIDSLSGRKAEQPKGTPGEEMPSQQAPVSSGDHLAGAEMEEVKHLGSEGERQSFGSYMDVISQAASVPAASVPAASVPAAGSGSDDKGHGTPRDYLGSLAFGGGLHSPTSEPTSPASEAASPAREEVALPASETAEDGFGVDGPYVSESMFYLDDISPQVESGNPSSPPAAGNPEGSSERSYLDGLSFGLSRLKDPLEARHHQMPTEIGAEAVDSGRTKQVEPDAPPSLSYLDKLACPQLDEASLESSTQQDKPIDLPPSVQGLSYLDHLDHADSATEAEPESRDTSGLGQSLRGGGEGIGGSQAAVASSPPAFNGHAGDFSSTWGSTSHLHPNGVGLHQEANGVQWDGREVGNGYAVPDAPVDEGHSSDHPVHPSSDHPVHPEELREGVFPSIPLPGAASSFLESLARTQANLYQRPSGDA
eukprot:scaffold7350_cov233-Pinguiococcus_pyrenoidosus.AAC.6